VRWKITALSGGKKVELRETQRAVTPFGGLVVFFEFLRQIGYREAVSKHPAVSSHFTQCHRSGGDLYRVLGGGSSAALRTYEFAPCRCGLARVARDRVLPGRRHRSQFVQAFGQG
jgi:hypothetical protein